MEFADQVFKMAGALAVVVGLLLGGMYVVKRWFGEALSNAEPSVMRTLGGLRVGQGKSLVAVEVAGEVLILGNTARELTLLTRVTDERRVQELRALSGNLLGRLGGLPGSWRKSPVPETARGAHHRE